MAVVLLWTEREDGYGYGYGYGGHDGQWTRWVTLTYQVGSKTCQGLAFDRSTPCQLPHLLLAVVMDMLPKTPRSRSWGRTTAYGSALTWYRWDRLPTD